MASGCGADSALRDFLRSAKGRVVLFFFNSFIPLYYKEDSVSPQLFVLKTVESGLHKNRIKKKEEEEGRKTENNKD